MSYVPIVYLWVYKQFLEKNCSHIETHNAISILKKRIYNLSTDKYYKILEDMEYFGLIKKESKRHYRILLTHQEKTKDIIDLPFFIL